MSVVQDGKKSVGGAAQYVALHLQIFTLAAAVKCFQSQWGSAEKGGPLLTNHITKTFSIEKCRIYIQLLQIYNQPTMLNRQVYLSRYFVI
jgi:hypothetical protein